MSKPRDQTPTVEAAHEQHHTHRGMCQYDRDLGMCWLLHALLAQRETGRTEGYVKGLYYAIEQAEEDAEVFRRLREKGFYADDED